MRRILILLAFLAIPLVSFTQTIISQQDIRIDYSNPREYEIGGITVSGVQYLDHSIIIMVSQLKVGEKIMVPGEKFAKAIENIWKQGLFQDVKITATSIQGNVIFLDIELLEKPRLSMFSFNGVKKTDADNLRDRLKIVRGDVVTENLVIRAEHSIKDYFIDKGYLRPEVTVRIITDTIRQNNVIVEFDIDRGMRTKIKQVNVIGNEALSDAKIKRTMKKTREKSLRFLFSSSKYNNELYKEDLTKIIDRYHEIGKRDAIIYKDSMYFVAQNRINIDLHIDEGNTYYYRDIKWVGNTKYPSDVLTAILGIKPGDVYNQKLLDKNLFMNMDGMDVSSLYLDDGYLFFNVNPVEVRVENDSIDLEIRIYEGQQARINKITLKGNTKTNDHVVMREIRTRPGQLFSRSDIIRSQRELAQLGYFDQEKLSINPRPNPADGTVDIEYVVEETSSDQIELSGGWGAGRVIGTLGLTFNNFSARNLFKKDAYRPLPSGDGQKLSLRGQTYGRGYFSYSASFVEPWLGGKKPNSFSVSFYQSFFNNGYSKKDPLYGSFGIIGLSTGLSRRLTVPDDFFFLQQSVSYQQYNVNNYSSYFVFNSGKSNIISYNISFGRNSIDAPIYPRGGSEVLLSLQATPPYSLFSGKDFSNATDQEKYKWLEYHKWKFNTSWFTRIAGNLVLSTRTRFGFIGLYNPDLGLSPFERFYLGGSGLTQMGSFDGREIIAMRGYDDQSLTPYSGSVRNYIGGTIFNKYTMELRYPVSLNPMATIYVLGFAEAGNAWADYKTFNPFEVKRSAGVGLRVFLPMFGLLGLDWGYGFDEVKGNPGANKGNFHFSIGQSID